MNKTKLTALALGFTTAAILCSCTDTNQTESQPDSVVTVTSGQTSEIQISSETALTSAPQDLSEQASQTSPARQDVSFSQVGDCRKINMPENMRFSSGLSSISDKILCGTVSIPDIYGNFSQGKIGFVDIYSGEFNIVSLPEHIDIKNVRNGSDDILCVMDGYRWDYADDIYQTITGYHKSIVKVKNDYSLEINEECSMSEAAFDFSGHKICEWNESIYDLSSGVEKKIIEGVPIECSNSKTGKMC